jgi:hypothetical protein
LRRKKHFIKQKRKKRAFLPLLFALFAKAKSYLHLRQRRNIIGHKPTSFAACRNIITAKPYIICAKGATSLFLFAFKFSHLA